MQVGRMRLVVWVWDLLVRIGLDVRSSAGAAVVVFEL